MVADDHAFDLSVEEAKGTLWLSLGGEIDLTAISSSEARLLLSRTTTPQKVVVDLSGVTFLDSAGPNFLLKLKARATDLDSSLRLVNVSAIAMRVLAYSGLRDHFDATEARVADAAD